NVRVGRDAMFASQHLYVTWTPTSDQVGSHPVVFRVTDGKGGYAEATYVIEVRPAAIAIGGVQVDILNPTSRQLTVTTSDPTAAFDGTFAWTVTSKPTGAPAPIIQPLNPEASSIRA